MFRRDQLPPSSDGRLLGPLSEMYIYVQFPESVGCFSSPSLPNGLLKLIQAVIERVQ
jgi:hypothetical protein